MFQKLLAKRVGMIAYLQLKVDERDWHGVADAAMDLREIDAQIKLLESQMRDEEA